MMIECFRCKKNTPLDLLLDTCHSYWSELNVLKCACPYCGQTSEIQIEDGTIWFGYIYAAGVPHFAGIDPVHINGLSVQCSVGSIRIEFEGKEWIVGQKQIREPVK
jgi:hypothetical protein